jgi:dienelactone hydrolase
MLMRVAAVLVTVTTLVSPGWQASPRTAHRGLKQPPVVTPTNAPVGTETFAVKWIRLTVEDLGVMVAAVARPSGAGPFPVVVLLHGTHGFAPQYVQWAQELARGGFLTVAGCWFSGGSGTGAKAVAPPIPCPEIPPLKVDAYPEAVQYIDALVQAARALPDARPDQLALVGHSRGGGEALQYLLAIGHVDAVVLHSGGHGQRPVTRAAEFDVPILILHGTADEGVNTRVALVREFAAALRRHQKSVEAHYYEGSGHTAFFTNPAQREDALRRMIEFLRGHLGLSRPP